MFVYCTVTIVLTNINQLISIVPFVYTKAQKIFFFHLRSNVRVVSVSLLLLKKKTLVVHVQMKLSEGERRLITFYSEQKTAQLFM